MSRVSHIITGSKTLLESVRVILYCLAEVAAALLAHENITTNTFFSSTVSLNFHLTLHLTRHLSADTALILRAPTCKTAVKEMQKMIICRAVLVFFAHAMAKWCCSAWQNRLKDCFLVGVPPSPHTTSTLNTPVRNRTPWRVYPKEGALSPHNYWPL